MDHCVNVFVTVVVIFILLLLLTIISDLSNCFILNLTFVNFYSLILLSVDSVMHLCSFCSRRIINV